MQQTHDFVAESEALAQALTSMPEADWDTETQFKSWTVNEVLRHLHFWNRAADLTLTDPTGFQDLVSTFGAQLGPGGMRPVERALIPTSGAALFDAWQALYRDMAVRWGEIDPKQRVPWIGPDMSARSMMTSRQMETWAHGQEVFDLLGLEQPQGDRVKNIVVLGVNTFGWSHQVQGLDVPDAVPAITLTAPSGTHWHLGEAASPDRIAGSAVEFAQVVTQTRNIADTSLHVEGPVATQWMATAQCFAGGRETPPAPGTRFRRQNM